MMERLTEIRDGQWVIPSRQDEKRKWVLCRAGMPRDESTAFLFGDYADRLAAYEDTGLTPGEVLSMKMDMAIINAMFQNTEVERMKELVEADKDGRLVVLPCKVGDTVLVNGTKRTVQATIDEAYLDDAKGIEYLVSFACEGDCDGCPFSDWKQDYSGEYSCDGEWGNASIRGADFGKTVFLTREETEAALEEHTHA